MDIPFGSLGKSVWSHLIVLLFFIMLSTFPLFFKLFYSLHIIILIFVDFVQLFGVCCFCWFLLMVIGFYRFLFYFLISFCLFFHLFLLVGGQLFYNIIVVFAIHWHESAMDLHVFPIPIPPPTSLSIPSLWVFPVHQPWALVSCIQPGLVVYFTLESILVSMLFSQNIPPSPSPTESKSLFCTSVSLFLFCI